MKYFKNQKNKPFAFEDDVNEDVLNTHIKQKDLVLITKKEFKILISPKFNDVLTSKINEINQLCEKAIVSGFESSALGTIHTYQSDRDDQTNLMGLVVDNSDDLLKCVDGAGTTEWKLHTSIQLKKVFEDGKQHKKDQLIKATSFKNLVSQATTVEDINQIIWE